MLFYSVRSAVKLTIGSSPKSHLLHTIARSSEIQPEPILYGVINTDTHFPWTAPLMVYTEWLPCSMDHAFRRRHCQPAEALATAAAGTAEDLAMFPSVFAIGLFIAFATVFIAAVSLHRWRCCQHCH